MGLPGTVLVGISTSLSAMAYWAVTYQSGELSYRLTLRPLMKLIGAADTLVSALVFNTSRSSENEHRTLDRQVSNLNGGFRSIHRGTRQVTRRMLSSATTRPPRQILPAWGTSDGRSVTDTARSH